VAVPELPVLAAVTNGPTGPTGQTKTNKPPALALTQTNNAVTNLTVRLEAEQPATNMATNAPIHATAMVTNSTATNAVTNVLAKADTNSTPATNTAAVTTNSVHSASNVLAAATAGGTNTASDAKPKKKRGGASPGDAVSGKGGADLPPAMQARIGKITDSEILGPVVRPLPMALLGIAGNIAFLRSDSGQTGLIKEGDTLDDLKLLRIGVNRVLIEQAGQKKELTIFSGYGSDSLLPNDSTNENKHL
jgi:hypothetical protein